jgi:hypothetical protein
MTHTDSILLMNGIDHQEAQPEVPMVLAQANARWKDKTIRQTTLVEHVEQVRDTVQRSGITLPCFEGESVGQYWRFAGRPCHAHPFETAQPSGRNIAGRTPSRDGLAGRGGRGISKKPPALAVDGVALAAAQPSHDDMYGSGSTWFTTRCCTFVGEQIASLLARDNLRALARHGLQAEQVPRDIRQSAELAARRDGRGRY